jgi:esterase/lipase superfamily enzyme
LNTLMEVRPNIIQYHLLVLGKRLNKNDWLAFSRRFASFLSIDENLASELIAARGDEAAIKKISHKIYVHLTNTPQDERRSDSFSIVRFLLRENAKSRIAIRNAIQHLDVESAYGRNVKVVVDEAFTTKQGKIRFGSAPTVLRVKQTTIKEAAAENQAIVSNHEYINRECIGLLKKVRLELSIAERLNNEKADYKSPGSNAGQVDIDSILDGSSLNKTEEQEQIIVGNPESGIASRKSETQQKGVVFPVWYATNRKLASSNTFCSERSSMLTYGKVGVLIPKHHRYGEIGASFLKRLVRLSLKDDKLVIRSNQFLTPEKFWGGMSAEHEVHRKGKKPVDALVFIHGYNVTFENAAIRAAQLGFDLKINGTTTLYSWPSKGAFDGYISDSAAIEASEKFISDFLIDFVRKSGADRVNIIAHSMGNRGLLRALQHINSKAELQTEFKLNQIFLAAPDIDRDLFMNLAYLYKHHSCRTTLYASPADMALHLSSEIHSAPRAGYYHPYTVALGVDTIDVPDFNLDFLGHGYFAQAEALLTDIFTLITSDAAPAERPRLSSEDVDGDVIWRFVR